MLAAGLSAYGASKAGLEAMSVAWSKDLEGTGVTVNVLVPGGPTDTPGFFPPGRPRPAALLDPEIMGVTAAWLASPQSDGISACASSRPTGTQACRRRKQPRACARRQPGRPWHRGRRPPAGMPCSRAALVLVRDAAISAGARAHQAPKATVERRQIVEAGVEGDGRDRRVRAPQA